MFCYLPFFFIFYYHCESRRYYIYIGVVNRYFLRDEQGTEGYYNYARKKEERGSGKVFRGRG